MPVDLLDLLTDGKVDAFNTARDRRETVDLFAADLANAKLAGVDFSGVNLSKADLSGADLTGAVLAKADLSGADLTGATLTGVVAIRSRWKEAYLGQADLTDADLQGADLSDADLSDAKLDGAKLAGARLKGVIATGASLTEADLSECRLSGANFNEADLSRAILREADLSRSTLHKARLCGADLTKARLSQAALKEADLTGANLTQADLTAADLSGAQVAGANLSRADLTEAVLEGVSLSEATTTYAEIVQGGAAAAEEAAPVPLHVEDASMAISNGHIGLLWENDEAGNKARLRLVVAPLDKPFDGRSLEIPLPTDAILSRSLVPTPSGFQIVVLLERPGGLVASVADVSLKRELGPLRSLKLEYTPAVRPVARQHESGTLLYGISREGPGLHVHRVDADKLTPLHRSPMATVRGFAGALYPVVLSKGGVLLTLGATGPGQPMRAPGAFPGRLCAATPMGTGLVLAWLEEGQMGFRLAFVKPGEAPDEMRLLPKFPIGALDMVEAGNRVWLALTKEDPRGRAPAQALAMRLPEGNPIPLEPGLDVDEVRFCTGATEPLVALTTLEGAVRLVSLEGGTPKLRWQMG